MDKLKRFIDIHIPISTCNFKCHYCYVPKAGKYASEEPVFPYSAGYIRKALSKERTGGLCLFNLCGMGETLISKETIEITKALLEEGHYVTLVTNGVLSNRFDEILCFDSGLLSRLMIKFSLHWKELKRLQMLDRFSDNVNKMRRTGSSVTVELTANDETEPYISEIMDYTLKEFGAKCHITIPRDESSFDFALQSRHNIDEFYRIWRVFESELLDFKYSIWGEHRNEYCYAGEWSGLLNIQTGEWRLCYHSHFSTNIFEDLDRPIPFVPVGKHCAVKHCFNGHSWLTLGDIPAINSHTYADVRDRVCDDGSHWITDEFYNFISQRLDVNNQHPHSGLEEAGYLKKKLSCYIQKGLRRIISAK